MLIKIGAEWFTLEGVNLVAANDPEVAPEEGTFLDATELAAEFDGLTFDPETSSGPLFDKTNELLAEYETARLAARKGGVEELAAAKAAQAPAVVANHLRSQRVAEIAALSDPALMATPANPSVEEEAPEAPVADAPAEKKTKVKPSSDDDFDISDIEIPADLSTLDVSDLQVLTAAAKIIGKATGKSSVEAFSSLMPGASPITAGGKSAARKPSAELYASANKNSVTAGASINDEQSADEIQRWARAAKSGRGPTSMTVGNYMMYGDAPAMVAGGATKGEKVEAGGLLDINRAGFHGLSLEDRQGAKAVTAAAPARCGPSDVRREIPDTGDMSSPLLDALQTYPAPHCELEYYRDISIAAVADGINVWDAAARADFQSARDAWLASVAAGDAPSTQAAAFATMKATEKACATAGCAPTDTVTMLSIAACLEYPTDLEYCSPQSIRAYRRALARLFLRERTANMLAVLETYTATVTVDASIAPFVNTEAAPVQIGASSVADMVISTLKPQGVMAERVTAGNYSVIIPYGLQLALELDGRLAEGERAISSIFGGANVITTLDTATGTALPFGAVPAMGSTNAFSTLRLPSDWDIHLVDLDDFFEISRPDIEVGAQITPETIKGNMVFGGFMESTAGYGKDGTHPAWTIAMSNLVYNGVRVDRMAPVGFGI